MDNNKLNSDALKGIITGILLTLIISLILYLLTNPTSDKLNIFLIYFWVASLIATMVAGYENKLTIIPSIIIGLIVNLISLAITIPFLLSLSPSMGTYMELIIVTFVLGAIGGTIGGAVSKFGLSFNNELRRELITKSPITYSGLKKLNIGAGIFLLAQGILMLILGYLLDWNRNIYTFYLKFKIVSIVPPNFQVLPDPQVIFTLNNLGIILSSFLLVSGVALLLIAFVRNKTYVENLKKGMNPYRWYEYAITSSLMLVIIATFVGVWDLWSLVMIFVLNAIMIMFGYMMEKINYYTKKTDWSAYFLGCISGFIPWVVLAAYFFAALGSSETNPPTFVYFTLLIYFIMFNTFSINMILQYAGTGKWKDYLYGERVYILLSFIAKTILAWLVFLGVFSPF